MTKMTAQEIMQVEYKGGVNFMTPNYIEWGKIGDDYAYEISSGRGIFDRPIFGVSIVKVIDHERRETTRDTGLSKLFYSQQEAEDYVNQLKREYGNSIQATMENTIRE